MPGDGLVAGRLRWCWLLVNALVLVTAVDHGEAMLGLNRAAAAAAVLIALLALVASTTGFADAAKRTVGKVVRTDRSGRLPAAVIPKNVVKVGKGGKVSSRVLPRVPRAAQADSVGSLRPGDLADGCVPEAVDLGTYCMLTSPYPLTNEEQGKNDFAFATQKCTELGGWLPSAAELVGAAARVKLASTIADSRLTATIDQDPSDGLKDRREMSATLVTTAAGSSAAGSQGVSDGAKGDPKQGEPDPVPQPANPEPDTLQYVTVYDNGDKGGFAGSRPIGDSEQFRCAFGRTQGQGAPAEGGSGGEGSDSGSGSGTTIG